LIFNLNSLIILDQPFVIANQIFPKLKSVLVQSSLQIFKQIKKGFVLFLSKSNTPCKVNVTASSDEAVTPARALHCQLRWSALLASVLWTVLLPS
jgi:hypothetical protein